MDVAAYLRYVGAQFRYVGVQFGTGSRQGVGNGVYALFQATALQYHHRYQYGEQGHADTSYGDCLGTHGFTIPEWHSGVKPVLPRRHA